jgi:hypothetical protein
MPNKITYTITTSDGKSHQVDEQNINKYGMQSYADAYKGATIRMRDKDGADYDIPLNRFTQARGQGLRPFRFEHRGTATNTQAGSHAQQVADEYDESVRRTQPRMTAAQKAKMSNWASSFGQNVGQATRQATQALKRQNDARKDNALRVRRENVGVDAAPYKLGENPNVVETSSTYNPQSGKVEKTYLTEAGNEYVGRDVADLEQNIIDDQKAREMDPVNTTLRDAYAERDRLEESMRQRMKEIDEERSNVNPVVRAFADLTESTQGGQAYNPFERYQRDEQYRQLEAAARKNRATIQTLEDKRDNKMNDFFHSIATTAANGYTFNDGLSEINDAIALLDARKHINSINRKQTTGEPLTEEEQAAASVLAADALNAEVQGQYAGDYGAWARAGQMVPTSIDLMKDIMLTPGAGGVAKGVAGKVAGIGTRFLAKQAGETAAKSAAKAIGRSVLKGTGILLGAHTAGAVVSNTAGIGRTIGAMGTNLAGQTVKDAQGNYKVQDSMDVLDAFVDAERNQIRENGSEMFGEFIPGAGGLIKKGLEKIGLSKISNALTNIGNKQWYQQYNRLLTAGGYNGIPGEALEEYEGMAFDALTGNAGETWQQLKDPRTHVDIWLGTAAMSALLGAAPVTIQGAHTAMYYRYKHATDKADRTAAYRFGDNEKWNGLKEVIDNTPNEDMANAVMDIMNDSSLYPEQKTAALNYVRNLTKMCGYNIGQMSNANEESEESKAANESYANGYNTENPEELNQIKNRYEVAREKALQAFPQETLDEIENDNSLLVQYVEAPTLRKIVVDYLNTKQAYDGMIQRVRDDIDTQVQQSNDMIESRINKTTGMIQPAMMKAPDENGNERRAYVISGNVEMLADMSGVDREKSDGSILVRYADTGEMEMVSPSAIMRVDDAISPEQEQQEAETNITQTYAQQKANDIDGKVAFAQGDVYTLTDEAGKVAQVTVVPNKDGIVDNGDGTVNVDAGTGEVVAMPKDAIQIMIDRTNKNKVVQQEEPAAAVTYNLNDDVYVQDENGNIVHGVITGDVNEDGQYEVQTDTPVKNVLVNLYTPDQFVQQPQATTTEQPAAEQAPAEQATEQQPSAEQQPANEQQVEQTQAEAAQEEQKPVIPTDEKGNTLYHQVPVETTINDLYDGKLDDNEIRDFVDANINEADKNLEKVNKKAPKIGTNKAEYLKKKQEWQKQVEDATRIRDYWNSVKNYIAQQTHTTPEEVKAAQDELSGEAARREYQDMGGSVQQDAVSVASDFIRGAKITPESFKAETGYGTDEQRKFVGMIAKAENGGKTIDRLAEELVSYDNAEMNGVLFGGDTSSAKDAILSALQGAGTRGELKQTNEAEEQAYIDARNAARDAQYMEQYGMTYEEYLAYEEQIMPTIWREYNNYDETAFNNMYAEEIEQLIKSRENDTTGEEQADDRGNQVLSEQQVTEQRGSEGGTEPGTEVQAGVQSNNENEAAPEEASGERIPNIERGRQGYTGYIARRQQNNLETSEEINVPLSQNEQDEYGNPMVLAENGSTVFGTIESESGLTEAPIKLSLGENKVGTDGKNHGYGLLHIEAGHGEQIRNAGYQSVEQFVENVAQNYTDIKEGALIGKKQTYLLEVSDEHNNTLFIQLSNDGTYWNVNSAGIFKKKYSRRKPLIYTVPAVGKSTVTDTSEVNSGQSMGATAPAGNSSESKDSDKSAVAQTIDEKIAKAEEETDVNPTEGQKEAGNYKKGHVRIDGYDITIEQPKGSVRRGTDADGKQWEQTMNNTYGYIRGTEGVDGDHIDIFLSDNPTEGNVYVVDQVNPDGSFDEHKVMYGFQSADDARAAYLSNYEEGWKGLGTITEVSKDEFKKWVNSSHRKTKPFSEYKSVNAIGAQNEERVDNTDITPGDLLRAYESGDTKAIEAAESRMRTFIESSDDMKAVAATYFRSKDNSRKYKKDVSSGTYRTQSFIAEACKNALLKAGIPKEAFMGERKRTDFARNTSDARVLDVMSADPSFDVLRAVLNNPNTSNSTLQLIADHTQYSYLADDARRILAERDGGVRQMLGETGEKSLSAEETAIRDAVIDRLRKSGFDVITDTEEGQRVLDEANGRGVRVRMQAMLDGLTKAANTIHSWIKGNKRDRVFTIELPESTQRKIKEVMGRDFDSHNITANGIAHALKNHGIKGNKLNKNSIPLREEDAELIPYIMTAPDYVKKASTDISGRESLRFYKELSNGYVVVVEKEYKNSPNDMETITMWAETSSEATNARHKAVPDTHVPNAILSTDAAKIRKDAETAIENDEKIREHRVYHGSAADFEAFDHSHMGEGEGAQAYGWGSYVTEVEGIGRMYAERMAAGAHSFASTKFPFTVEHESRDYLKRAFTDKRIRNFEKAREKAIKDCNSALSKAKKHKDDVFASFYKKCLQRITTISEDEYNNPQYRHLYTVEIPDDTGENYLDWSNEISEEQKNDILNSLSKLKNEAFDYDYFAEKLEDYEDNYNLTGEGLYKLLSRYGFDNNYKAASEALNDIGFTGISYPAEYRSGGREDGARNYVIFNEEDLKITDHVHFFRTPNGETYGFTVGGRIYVDPRVATADTPIHEYAHLWASALRQGNPEEWRNVVGLMKGTPVWDEVRRRYPKLTADDDIADEVLATYSGRRGAERLKAETRKAVDGKGVFEAAQAVTAMERVKEALRKFWKGVADFLHIHYTSAEEVADRVMSDLLEGRTLKDSKEHDDTANFAKKHNLNEKDVEDYADYIRRGNLNGASRAFKEIRRKVRLDNQGASLGQFAKIFSPIEKELYERFGNIDELRQQYVQRTLDERNAMEAARKKAEEEAEAERRRLQEFQNMSSEQLDAEYMKAVEANDEIRMRNLVNEAARRNGYGDVGSEYQGVGAWSAPSNPGYESDEERRAAVENDAPDVNITDIANGYSQQPSDYFTNLRAYGTDTAHGRESAEAINKAIDEVRNGKDPMVKVYRAVPKSVKEGKLRNGDWVTPSRKYAEMHGDNRLEGDYRIIEQEVPASQIWWDGNDINEWGFDDGKGYAYRNTKNNRKLNDLITRDDKGNIIPLSQRFNARKADVRYRNTENQAATDNIEDVNKQFNQQLEGLTEENADKVTLSLGRPSAVLRAAGVEDKPMKLYGNKVIKKMRKHGFTLAEIKDLPRAVADPIAVFNNYQKNGNRSILTELQIGDKHILVSVTVGKTGVDADFNIVSSVFGKGSNNVVDWINKGYATFINKEKALDYLHFSERSISEASDNQELVSTANIIRNFENPNVLEENLVPTEQTNDIDTAVADTANKLNIGVRVAHSIDEVNNDSVRRAIEQGRRIQGFYDTRTGEIVVYAPNAVDAEDAVRTVLHEGVAHYGLRQLVGEENFGTFLDNIYNNVSDEIKSKIDDIARKNKLSTQVATEEYLASLAENTNFEDMNASWWNKIKDLFLSMVRSIGLKGFSGKTLSDNELRYILWRSYENLKNPGRYRNVFSEAEDIAKQNELKVGNYAVRETRESVADNDLYREVEPEERRRVYVADIYDARIKNGMYQMREAVQDSMLSLREAMTEILKAEGNKNVKIEDIAGFENAYLGENRLSSVNKAEADAFANLLFKPLLEEAANLSGSEKGGRDELVNYMMAKHGLERNKVMAERDAKNEYDNYVKEHPKGEKTLDDFIEKYRKRDYAGLTALTGKEKVAEAEAEAQQIVDDYEAEHDTEELWNKTRAVSNAILDKEYDTGLMSKDTMEKLKSMFDYYIPLRGFDEKTSEDEYAYLENKNSAFFAPIKAAKGRKSKADDPFAYLQGMAENAIMQGNRNKLVKQKFLNFVLNHQSDLASVSDLWLKYNEVNDEWEPVFPDNIKDTDTAKEVERKMQEFEERMQQLAEEEPELYKHGKQTVEVPYRVVESRDLKQHQILVRRNGRNYVITINGNPRAAQAVNGLTNPDNDMSGAIGAILKAGQNLNRQLSAFYTTRNPDFVVSNFIRDALYANSMAWVKERPNYALRFHKNYVLANPIKMKKLFARYRKNKLKANSKTDMMFKQFMLNGGETGYASVRDIEKRKNEISKEIKKYQGKLPIKKAWGYLAERFDEFNRAVENSARFAAFVTSREMGRSIERSIYDAKEISVNFNKKGSGSKFMGATGQTKLGNAGAFISGLGRSGFVFWNAAIQGSTNFGRQVKHNPAKALTAMATMFMLGAVVASLGYGDDDDDDKNSYWNLPDYVRRSNIMFRAGDQWVSIPLPVEYRSLYGLGELMISTMSDKEHLSGDEIANQIAGQISQVMPIDILEGGGGAKAFVPSFIKPFAEAYGYNRSWTGMPIYKDTDFNKDLPEWTKAYKSANKYLVDLSETLNEATGGDKYTKGEIDINPAKIEHVLTGYFGGIANTIDRLTKMGETAIGQREYDPNSILIWNRIVKNGDERTEYKAINNEYFRIKKEHDTLKKRLNNYERDTENGVFDYAEKIDFLYNSPEYRRLEIYEEYQPDIEDLIIMLDETNDADEQRDIEAQINELKKMMISDINKYARK